MYISSDFAGAKLHKILLLPKKKAVVFYIFHIYTNFMRRMFGESRLWASLSGWCLNFGVPVSIENRMRLGIIKMQDFIFIHLSSLRHSPNKFGFA